MHRMTTRARRALALVVALVVALLALSACTGDGGQDDATKSEQKITSDSYKKLAKNQPAHQMGYSPTRATLNFWIDTWGKNPNKLAYVYLQNTAGDLIGYYVMKGLPVSYCAALTPNYKVYDGGGDGGGGNLVLPAASADGVYYSGGQCNTYFGRDASTNAYVEYTAGLGINVLLYDEPLPNNNVKPLGPTKVK